MVAPRGKGIYARSRFLYPEGDPAAYAYAMGCQFVVFLDNVADWAIHRAHEFGLDSYLYAMPEDWTATEWKRTLYRQLERVRALRMRGLIADPENGWAGAGMDRIAVELGAALASAAQTVPSVGLTSYPSWAHLAEVAAEAAQAGVWGSPQLYGVLEPAPNPVLKARGDRWRKMLPATVPSLAAWSRTPQEQALYLDTFTDESGAIFWHSTSTDGKRILPSIGSESFNVLRDWNPRGGAPGSGPDAGALDVFAARLARPIRMKRG